VQRFAVLIYTGISLLVLNCKKNDVIKPVKSINQTVDQGDIPNDIPSNSIKYKDTALEKILIDGDSVLCKSIGVDRTERINTFDYFYAQDKADIWPGNIVQSKYLRNDGRLISIGAFPREKLDYSITGTLGSMDFYIMNPNIRDYKDQLDENSKYFWFMKPMYSYFQVQKTYSTQQALIDLGINFNFLTSSAKATLSNVNSTENQTMYMIVKSNYFNVSVEYPSSPAGFFGPNIDIDNLQRIIQQDNAPAYISSVTYGRLAIIKIKSKKSQRETKAAIEVFFKGVSGDLTLSQKQIISECEITVEAAPGSSNNLLTIEDVKKFLDEGVEFNHRTGYVPVAYDVRYLKDNSPLMTYTSLSYKIYDCL